MKHFIISPCIPTGGSAGKGKNRTSSIQVIDDTDSWCALVVKQFRYNVGDEQSRQRAIDKARQYIESLELTTAG